MRWFETFKWFGPDISRKETAGKESEPEPASGVDAMCQMQCALFMYYIMSTY